jgi:hypothetical protein
VTIEPEPTPRRGSLLPPGTIRRAGLMFGLLASCVLFVAWVWPDRRPITEVERYLRRGQVAAAQAIRQDLLRLSPQGADSGPAVQHLIKLGFACAAPVTPSGQWYCTHRRPEQPRRVVILEARIRLHEGATSEITTRIWDEPLP